MHRTYEQIDYPIPQLRTFAENHYIANHPQLVADLLRRSQNSATSSFSIPFKRLCIQCIEMYALEIFEYYKFSLQNLEPTSELIRNIKERFRFHIKEYQNHLERSIRNANFYNRFSYTNGNCFTIDPEINRLLIHYNFKIDALIPSLQRMYENSRNTKIGMILGIIGIICGVISIALSIKYLF